MYSDSLHVTVIQRLFFNEGKPQIRDSFVFRIV